MIRGASVVAIFVLFCTPAIAEVSVGKLLQNCNRMTQVWGRVGTEPRVVGERMDGFCEGYLLASYYALVARGFIHSESGGAEVTADFLKSVVEVYVKENPATNSQAASSAIMSAYSRAFPEPRKK